MDTKEHAARTVNHFFAAAVLFFMIAFSVMQADAATTRQKEFGAPEEAVKALLAAARAHNDKELMAIFGSGAKELLFSGDPASDKERREKLIAAYDKKNSIAKEGDKMVLIIGEKDWPFPIPLVKQGEKWIFDTKAGREEILNRRIGQNELFTIQTMLAIVDAQREYAMADHDGNGLLEYAGKFQSDPGKKNGLYWDVKEGEAPSPLGALVVQAKAEGYKRKGSKGNPVPYHGYYYLMLSRQGKNAQGGAFEYVVKGKQIGGFAVVAYPATYGNSGVMTFMVNHDGVVYQKNLGKNTAKTVKAMKSFDPDSGWKKAE